MDNLITALLIVALSLCAIGVVLIRIESGASAF